MKHALFALAIFIGLRAHAAEHYIALEKPEFELITDRFFSQALNFNSLAETKKVNLTYWGSIPQAEIRYNASSLLVRAQENELQRVHLQLEQKVKTIVFNMQTQPADYDQEYIQMHEGKVSIETPEVYELNNIVLALADKYHQTHYRMHSKGRYYADVLTWFSPFKNHPIFRTLNEINYYSLVENGPAYTFDGDTIARSAVYKGFRADDAIEDNKALLEDFARKSDFRKFYQQHRGYYSQSSEVFELGAQPKTIWQWLESHFPARYQSYRIFFSPLGPGNNSSRMFDDNDFKESIMFVSAPNRYESEHEASSTQWMKFTRSFFTEIDHTYVNPISDQYIDDINAAFIDLAPWYKGGGYNKPYLVFNEYMTWSIFSLYAREHYSAEDYAFSKSYIERFMVEKRGFYKFKGFNEELIRLYINRPNDDKITDLYPKMISWIRNNVDH